MLQSSILVITPRNINIMNECAHACACVRVCARGVMVIVVRNENSDLSLTPGQGISHSANTLGKGMNPTILPPAMDK